MTPTPPIIGIAGGIGSGKSAVADILADAGCLVVNSDDAGRAALREPSIRDELIQWWGREILDDHGAVDRSRVAAIVFRDPAERKRLEGLTHPWIEARRREQFAGAGPDVPALVIDAPLLFEAGLGTDCDAVIFVDTSRAVRLERVQRTRNWTDDELRRREESQLPLDEKQQRADYVLQNDGDLKALAEQVRRILRDIVNTHDNAIDEVVDASGNDSELRQDRDTGSHEA